MVKYAAYILPRLLHFTFYIARFDSGVTFRYGCFVARTTKIVGSFFLFDQRPIDARLVFANDRATFSTRGRKRVWFPEHFVNVFIHRSSGQV